MSLFIFSRLGTPPNSAIQKYLNEKKVPQLFIATGATKWGDPEHFPWTMGFQPSYQTEGSIYAQYILLTSPTRGSRVLYQNDDFGKDYLKGLKDALGDKAAKLIVAEVPYEVTDPTIDSQIVSLQASAPMSSTMSRRRNSRRRPSARPTTSAGGRCIC